MLRPVPYRKDSDNCNRVRCGLLLACRACKISSCHRITTDLDISLRMTVTGHCCRIIISARESRRHCSLTGGLDLLRSPGL